MLVRAARAPGMPYEDLRLISIHIYAFSLSPRSGLCCAFCFSEVENEKDKMIGFHVPHDLRHDAIHTVPRSAVLSDSYEMLAFTPLSVGTYFTPALSQGGGCCRRLFDAWHFSSSTESAGPRPP